MKSNSTLISVVIPVKNGGDTIDECLQGIFSQTIEGLIEVIIIDSGSTDNTLDLISKYRVRVHRINPDEFNHGETRNLGVRLARGEFIFMTVQDAISFDNQCVEKMLAHFSDESVVGVCGLQIVPHEQDKNPIQWFRPATKPEAKSIFFPTAEEFMNLHPKQKIDYCSWDNVTAMYRRSILLKIPFRKVFFAEDVLWAKEVLQNGYTLVYEKRAQVYHYHHYTFLSRFKRVYLIQYHYYLYFNYIVPFGSLLFGLAFCGYRLLKENEIHKTKKIKWFFYNAKVSIASYSAKLFFKLILVFCKNKIVKCRQ